MTSPFDRAVALITRTVQSVDSDSASPLRRFQHKGIYAAFNRLIGLAIPFVRRNRFEVLDIKPGYLKARVALRGNKNHMGTMYAGAMFLLAEIPGGVITIFEFGPNYVPVLKELTMTYLKLAKSDVTIEFSLTRERLDEIRREADENGKSEFSLKADLRDVNGETVAQSMGYYQVRRKDGRRT